MCRDLEKKRMRTKVIIDSIDKRNRYEYPKLTSATQRKRYHKSNMIIRTKEKPNDLKNNNHFGIFREFTTV